MIRVRYTVWVETMDDEGFYHTLVGNLHLICQSGCESITRKESTAGVIHLEGDVLDSIENNHSV